MTSLQTKFSLIGLYFLFPLLLLAQQTKKNIEFNDILKSRTFASKGIDGLYSMKDGKHFCVLKKDSLNEYDYETGKLSRVIVTSAQLIPTGKKESIGMSKYSFSNDETKILFSTESEEIYRYSEWVYNYIFDLKTGILTALSDKGKQRVSAFSPDDTKIAFVRGNNIFIRDITAGIGNSAIGNEIQITSDGRENEIINGVPDWVNEEEFEFIRAFEWSPDGLKIAFYRFDESKVKEYDLQLYGELYPSHYRYKYPVPGEANSIISIHIYDLKSGKTLKVDIGQDSSIYIPRIKWTEDPGKLALYRMNRHQNELEMLLADAETGLTTVIYKEEDKCYLEINDHLKFLKNGKGFILNSEKDGFRHIYHYDMEGNLIRQITSGTWEVTELYGIDESQGLIYYQSTESSPLNKDLYAVSMDGKRKIGISSRPGTNTPEFSSTYEYFINRWSDANTPPYITLNRANGDIIRILQSNEKLISKMKEYNLSRVEFFTFKTSKEYEINCWMLKPPDFDPLKKYPVLFAVYGGPGSQNVLNTWRTASFWNRYLAQNGLIIINVDPRGTAGKGADFKKLTYLQLGKYETEDMVETAKYLSGLPFIDSKRIGIWGWSYGGFMTLSCLTRASDYFSMGVAVAPVTHYKYYDDIYTERFMRTPQENPEGYERNSPINHVDKFKGKLLLIHGMADDNVHPQNSYDFMTAMVGADKQFESQYYPNSNHGIYTGSNTTYHLYKRMTDFILKNL